ncbi:MAG: hypothetical protein PW792_06660 [Acidobacteriaceae bacterium]|nr:hypothetical protein [Acidobacteriaceae bacterium]
MATLWINKTGIFICASIVPASLLWGTRSGLPCDTHERSSALSTSRKIAILTPLVLFVHGFHPLAEDGGLYVAGIKWLLHPGLFPHDSAFVTEHLRFSLFAPFVAGIVRTLHIPLLWALFGLYLLTTALTLYATHEILRRCGFTPIAQLYGTAMLAAWWAIPVAGTSLMLMDPYLTGRSFSTPLGLLAVGWSLERTHRAWILSLAAILLAAAFHPLMAVYALGLVLSIRIVQTGRPWWGWAALLGSSAIAALLLQLHAQPATPALRLAVYSRYYWFLSQWQWFELLGLLGPLVVLGLLLRKQSEPVSELLRGTIALDLIAILITVCFAHERYSSFPVAMFQPLRVFLLTYALMLALLGSRLANIAERQQRLWPVVFLLCCMAGAHQIARATFPSSSQVEWPWHEAATPNPWVQAFLWARHNTAPDTLFALDAKYVNTDGEDAQTFRAIAERSTLADFSKDGGEAAITPALADRWLRESAAQKNLSKLDEATRTARLAPFPVTWMVLHAEAATDEPCPYRNLVVKVCRLHR